MDRLPDFPEFQALLSSFRNGNDGIGIHAGRDDRKPLHFEHRLKEIEGIVYRELHRRNDRYLAFHPLIKNEILAGYFADKFRDNRQINVHEVKRDSPVTLRFRRNAGRSRQSEQRKNQY